MPATTYTVLDGEIVSESRAGVLRDYVSDPLGNTVALLDNTQTQTDQWAYFPYGESVRIKGSTQTPMTFVGNKSCRQDGTSTRSYMQNRVLDMPKARWMTEDPIGEESNLYGYVSDRPVVMVDPTGLIAMPHYYYCGPNGEVQYDPCCPEGKICAPATKPAPYVKSQVDLCCKDHDCCWKYVEDTTGHTCGPTDTFSRCANCNGTFCDCINDANCFGKKACLIAKGIIKQVCKRVFPQPPPDPRLAMCPGSPPPYV